MEGLAADVSANKLARAIIQVLTLKKLACKSNASKVILDAAIKILLSEDDCAIFPNGLDAEITNSVTKAISKSKTEQPQKHVADVKRLNDITLDENMDSQNTCGKKVGLERHHSLGKKNEHRKERVLKQLKNGIREKSLPLKKLHSCEVLQKINKRSDSELLLHMAKARQEREREIKHFKKEMKEKSEKFPLSQTINLHRVVSKKRGFTPVSALRKSAKQKNALLPPKSLNADVTNNVSNRKEHLQNHVKESNSTTINKNFVNSLKSNELKISEKFLPNENIRVKEREKFKQIKSEIKEKPIAELPLSRQMLSHESPSKKRALLPLPTNTKSPSHQIVIPQVRKVLLPPPCQYQPIKANNTANVEKKSLLPIPACRYKPIETSGINTEGMKALLQFPTCRYKPIETRTTYTEGKKYRTYYYGPKNSNLLRDSYSCF